jgi:hypothetical protein
MGMVFRILLSLALVLNGTSGAWAMDAGVAPTKAPPAMADGAPSCHDHADAPSPTAPAPDPSDCCQTAACQCACAHLPAVAFLSAAVLASLSPGTEVFPVVIHRHAAPSLPHQLRPPIG